jgi:alkylation response protein AidB-like acyl-CoA dehydrogenase
MLADWVLIEVESQLGLVDARMARRQAIGGAGSLIATLSWDAPAKLQLVTAPFAAGALGLGAVVYSGLLAGAMQRVTAMTLQYCNERSQFGRSIGKFQAVQHQLSAMAEQVAAASIAAESALAHDLPSLMDCALAKARASEAAPLIAATAHALHGAIGVTAEYDLQLYTRRLHEWRAACGGELYWQQWLGSQVLASHAKTLAEFVRTAR